MKLGSTSLSATQPGKKTNQGIVISPFVYDLTADTSVNEGATLVCNVSVNLPAGDGTLYWDIAHNTTNASDFTAVNGTVTVSNQSGSFNINTVADNTTEGTETFDINLRTGSAAGPIVSQVIGVTVNDTSITPVTRYYYWWSYDAGSSTGDNTMMVYDVTNNTVHSMSTHNNSYFNWTSRSVNIAQFSGSQVKFAHAKQNKNTTSPGSFETNDAAIDKMHVIDAGVRTNFYPTSTGTNWTSSGSGGNYSTAGNAVLAASSALSTTATCESWSTGSGSTPTSGTGPSGAYFGLTYYYYESTPCNGSYYYLLTYRNKWRAIRLANAYTVS